MPSKQIREWITKAQDCGVVFTIHHIEGGFADVEMEYIDILIRSETKYWSLVLDVPENLISAFTRYRLTSGTAAEFQCKQSNATGAQCKNRIIDDYTSLDEFCELYPTGLCRLHRQLNSRSSEVTT